MDELRTRNYLSIKWTLHQNSKEWVNEIIQFERWTCKQPKHLNQHEAQVWRASQVHNGLGVVYVRIAGGSEAWGKPRLQKEKESKLTASGKSNR